MATAKKLWTYEDYAALDDDKRYEVIEGELIEMSSPNRRHQQLLLRFARSLGAFVDDNALGEVYLAPFDVVLSPINVLQPDVMFISNANANVLTALNVQGAPDLCVEILSPSTASRDRRQKHRLYREFGVREYWLVDPDAQRIVVSVLEEGQFVEHGTATGATTVLSTVVPGYVVDATVIFR